MSAAEEQTPKTTTKKVSLRPAQWAIAEASWRKGEATADELAKRFGAHRTTIIRHMKAKGIAHGEAAEETRRKVAEQVESAIDEDAMIQAARIRETKEEHFKMAQGLGKLAWNELLKAKSEGVPLSAATGNLKAIELAANVMTKVRIEKWAILGLDRPDSVDITTLPELVIKELTADQIEALQSRSFNPYNEDDLKPDDDTPGVRAPESMDKPTDEDDDE